MSHLHCKEIPTLFLATFLLTMNVSVETILRLDRQSNILKTPTVNSVKSEDFRKR